MIQVERIVGVLLRCGAKKCRNERMFTTGTEAGLVQLVNNWQWTWSRDTARCPEHKP